MLTAAELQTFRKKLLALAKRAGQIHADLEQEGAGKGESEMREDLDDSPVDPAEAGNQALADQVNNELLGIEQSMEQDISDALARIDAGTFGICLKCGKGIAKARLQALPYVRLCIHCAEKEAMRR